MSEIDLPAELQIVQERAYADGDTWTGDLIATARMALTERQHCATCQCERIHGEPPAPGNPRSKTWHGGAGSGDLQPK